MPGVNDIIRPAIIIAVFDGNVVNLEVFGEPPDMPNRFPTSVVQGGYTGQWDWPPRV